MAVDEKTIYKELRYKGLFTLGDKPENVEFTKTGRPRCSRIPCDGVYCGDCIFGNKDVIKEWINESKGYRTKDIDFSGCHEVIATNIKDNKATLCTVWDDDTSELEEEWIIAYASDGCYTDDSGFHWDNAKPLGKATVYVKKASEIVKWFEDNGYSPSSTGCWNCEGKMAFTLRMFTYCGKEKPEEFVWLPEWLEEK